MSSVSQDWNPAVNVCGGITPHFLNCSFLLFFFIIFFFFHLTLLLLIIESQLSGVPVESLKVNPLFPHFMWTLLTKREHGCNGRTRVYRFKMALSMNADSSAHCRVFSSNEVRNEEKPLNPKNW